MADTLPMLARLLLSVPVIVAATPALQGLLDDGDDPAAHADTVRILPLRVQRTTQRLDTPEFQALVNAVVERLGQDSRTYVVDTPPVDRPDDPSVGCPGSDVRCIADLGAQVGANRVLLVEVGESDVQIRVHVTVVDVADGTARTLTHEAPTAPEARDSVSRMIEALFAPDPGEADRAQGPASDPPSSTVSTSPNRAAAAPMNATESTLPRPSFAPVAPFAARSRAGLRGGSIDMGAADGPLPFPG